MHPDLAARKVIIACYLYYNLNSPIISDHEYERLVKLVVSGWSELHPDRKWALGSPESIAATGNGIKVSLQAIHAARREWCKHYLKTDSEGPWPYHGEGTLYLDTQRKHHFIIARD